jgi:uncharacterized protein with LGFP repeats
MSRHHVSRGSRASLLALTALLVAGPVLFSAAPAGAAPVPAVQQDPEGTAAAVAVPGAPTGVTAVGGDRSVTVSWSGAPDNGSPITGYVVTSDRDQTVAVAADVTTATLTGLENGRSHTVWVSAVNAVGTGPTAMAGATPTGAVPSAPRSVTAVPRYSSATVSWLPPSDNAGAVTYYTVFASPQPGGRTAASGTATSGTSVEVYGLGNGTAYTFVVQASNGYVYGPESARTAPVVPGGSPTAIQARWEQLGSVLSDLGTPRASEVCGLRGGGCAQEFTDGGIYWSPATGARVLYQDLWKYVQLGAEASVLGYPVTDEQTLYDGGRVTHFQGGSIYEAKGTYAPHAVLGAIRDKWAEGHWQEGPLGYPTSDELPLPGGGAVSHFQGGSIYWSPATGAHVVRGLVRDSWVAQGAQAGALGYPTTDEIDLFPGAVSHFQGGSIYFSGPTGAHVVRGAIDQKLSQSQGPRGFLGFPVTDEVPLPGGAVTHFERGSIYWSPAAGAHWVRGLIRDEWASLGAQTGVLGYPTTDEVGLGGGAVTHFQNGSIYFSPASGSHAVVGAIRDKWASLGWQGGRLGYPTTGELPLAGGAVSHFQGGSIYFSPATGAHMVTGAIRDRWAAYGGQDGMLGYPTSDEVPVGFSPWSYEAATHFQGGSIYFSGATGAHVVRGAIRDKWASMGWQRSVLGYPTSEEYDVPGGRRSDFQFGSITWTPARGAVSSR